MQDRNHEPHPEPPLPPIEAYAEQAAAVGTVDEELEKLMGMVRTGQRFERFALLSIMATTSQINTTFYALSQLEQQDWAALATRMARDELLKAAKELVAKLEPAS